MSDRESPPVPKRLLFAFQYAGLKAAMAGVGAMPMGAALAFGRGLGRAAAALAPKYLRRAEENLAKAFPERDEKWVRDTAIASFEHFGQAAVEGVKSRGMTAEGWRKVVDFPDEAPVLDIVREGKGMIICGGHLGNWELAAMWASVHGFPMTSVAHRLRNERIFELLTRERARAGTATVEVEGALRPLLRALKKGELVALLTDRNPRDQGILVPFFGRDILTVTAPALLAIQTGATIMPFACLRTGKGFRYRMRWGPPIRPDRKADKEEETARLTRESTTALENFIREEPGQWQWMHRRWKITPGGLKRAGIR